MTRKPLTLCQIYDGEWWRAAAPDVRASVGDKDVAVALCDQPLSARPWAFVGLVTRRDMRAPSGHAAALEALKAFAEEELAATEDSTST